MRFVNPNNTEGDTVTNLRHSSLDNSGPPLINSGLVFYRGPLPATNSRPDNVYNFYQNRKFRSMRVLQPNLNGSL